MLLLARVRNQRCARTTADSVRYDAMPTRYGRVRVTYELARLSQIIHIHTDTSRYICLIVSQQCTLASGADTRTFSTLHHHMQHCVACIACTVCVYHRHAAAAERKFGGTEIEYDRMVLCTWGHQRHNNFITLCNRETARTRLYSVQFLVYLSRVCDDVVRCVPRERKTTNE